MLPMRQKCKIVDDREIPNIQALNALCDVADAMMGKDVKDVEKSIWIVIIRKGTKVT